jgi:hypothetical protein
LTPNVIPIYWYVIQRGGKVMKEAVKRIVRDEKGRVMELVLILLTVGGLIMAPLLGLMSTGLLAGEVYEQKTAELYAADAGVEDAVWKIENQVDEVKYLYCGGGNHSWSYPQPGDAPFEVNDKSVEVTITWVDNLTYRVESIATGNGTGTQIEAYITGVSKYGDYSGLLDHILTSPGEINVANKVILEYPEGADPYPYYPDDWPEVWELEDFYGDQVKDGRECSGYTAINLQGNNCPPGPIYINGGAVSCPSGLEPLYVDGELDILNSSNTPATLTLNGTIYATGNTEIGTTGKDMTLDLAGQTIFVSSNATGSQQALIMGGKCTLKGPGVIIVIGDIEFKPKSQVGEEEGGGPVFVLSVSGTSYLQPSGHVYGAIAGSVEVYVQQGEQPVITYPVGGFDEEGLNFLTGIRKLIYSIASWEVSAA